MSHEIRVTITDTVQGTEQVLEGDQALVLMRDGETEGDACLAGSDDVELLRDMVEAAGEHVATLHVHGEIPALLN